MKLKLTIFILTLIMSINTFAQIQQNDYNLFQAKEFSKDISLFKAKTFLIHNVLKTSESALQFEAIPLAAASSGEMTTLLYKCESQNKEGLVLGFYGEYWNDAGVIFQGYGFKNLSKDQAFEFLNKIESEIDKNNKFLKSNNDNNNIVFEYNDLKVVIWTTSGSYLMRIYWNGFDSTWEKTSYERSKRRFERKI
ncbi:hypothetical protein [Confluentibacter flavum]|uniref:DUF4375 domain-containing protein n=1 Tax=Confluentibacter flavum TaxID=1909700 RepID=A0A2N3HPJ8_9FLAO|nr:hypothetical protein [Confluentibacter flavum]PKQ46875.1 hypothetical protein CSW08_00760 [Confluentibacter flavum]